LAFTENEGGGKSGMRTVAGAFVRAASSLPWKADYRTGPNIVNWYFAMFNYEST